MRTRRLLSCLWLLVAPALSCAPDDACDAMCDAALTRFSSCLDERGLQWGASVGYTDANDYANWCQTWTWEQRELGQADTCADKRDTFETGDCDAYFAAWADE